nr:putative ribonuclease H-like domain-containing protein [Tanacetum cinerariifolium]
MDRFKPMRVASINRKNYILIIVAGYTRFTWVKFLASKDKAPDFIIKFLKMIQVRLNTPTKNIRTDNRTKFVNQTLRSYYESVSISHETSVTRSPQQNGVVERRNHTLVEAARIMLIYVKAPLFLWAEAVATVIPVAAAPRAVDSADSPVSTSIDQDAPSTSMPSTQDQEHSLISSQGFEESPKTPHFHDDPLHESLYEDSTSQGSSFNMRPIYTPFKALGRCTKDHPIANVIKDPSRFVSTRKQQETDAMSSGEWNSGTLLCSDIISTGWHLYQTLAKRKIRFLDREARAFFSCASLSSVASKSNSTPLPLSTLAGAFFFDTDSQGVSLMTTPAIGVLVDFLTCLLTLLAFLTALSSALTSLLSSLLFPHDSLSLSEEFPCNTTGTPGFTPVPLLVSEDFMYQADNREISSAGKEHMPYPRFTKVINSHFISKDKTIYMRNMINLHIIHDDSLLGTLKFVSKTKDSHKKVALNIARKFKKIASPLRNLSPVKEAEPVKKAKRVKRPVKKSTNTPTAGVVIRETPRESVSKKKAPAKVDRGKGIELLLDATLLKDAQLKKALEKSRQETHKLQASGSSKGANFESEVPDESKAKPSDTSKGTGVKPGVPVVLQGNSSDSDNESWGNSKDESNDVNADDNANDDDSGNQDHCDNDAHDSERTDSDDDDENPFFTLKNYDEEEHDEVYKYDNDNKNVYEEEDDDVCKDVDVRSLGVEHEKERKGDEEMTDADQNVSQEKLYK